MVARRSRVSAIVILVLLMRNLRHQKVKKLLSIKETVSQQITLNRIFPNVLCPGDF